MIVYECGYSTNKIEMHTHLRKSTQCFKTSYVDTTSLENFLKNIRTFESRKISLLPQLAVGEFFLVVLEWVRVRRGEIHDWRYLLLNRPPLQYGLICECDIIFAPSNYKLSTFTLL